MTYPSAADVRTYVLDQVKDGFGAAGVDLVTLPDDADLLADGVIDSFGALELMAATSDRFGIEGDWEDYPPEDILVIGAFCRYVERHARGR
jgi:acyl carrier protein